MKKINLIYIICVGMILLTGCWDNVDINNREYLFAVGIDENTDKLNEGRDKFIFTAEVPKLNTGSKDEHFVFQEKSENFSKFYYNAFMSTDKVVSDRLMQTIVIGENVAKNPEYIKTIFDEIERSPQINRKVKLCISKGSAQDIINTKIPYNPIVGRYLSQMLIKLKNSNYQNIYTFDEALLIMHNFGNGMIPLVEKRGESLKIEGSAIMKDYHLIGYLELEDNEIIMMLQNPKASNINGITVEVDNTPVTLAGEDITMTKKFKLEGDKLTVNYYVTLYCYIDSYKLGDDKLSQADYMEKIKSAAVEKLSRQTDVTLYKLQNTYKIDLLRIQEHLFKFKNSEYKKISDNYEAVFSNADINVDYSVVIKSTGLVK